MSDRSDCIKAYGKSYQGALINGIGHMGRRKLCAEMHDNLEDAVANNIIINCVRTRHWLVLAI